MKSNIVLIGLPGAGKSTVGRWLAREYGLRFVDADVLLEQQTNMTIQQVVDRMGLKKFAKIEQDVLTKLDIEHAVISTGGSAVYSESAMRHLSEDGIMLYLRISEKAMLQRVDNTASRGLFKFPAHPLQRIYRERINLYPKYAEVTFDNNAAFTAYQAAKLKQLVDACNCLAQTS